MQHLEVQHALHLGVHRVFGTAGDHVGCGWCSDAGADRLAGGRFLDLDDAVDRILDRAVSRAAAQVSLQRARQILLLLIGERRRSHDHARGAEAALETGGVSELSLQRVQVLRCAEPLDRGDLASLGAKRRRDAAVHRIAVEPHRAGAAIACVTTLFDAMPAERPHECAKALPRSRLVGEGLAVDGVGHASSPRISSAKCLARCRRWSGVPFGSSNHTSSGIESMPCCSVVGIGHRIEREPYRPGGACRDGQQEVAVALCRDHEDGGPPQVCQA